MKHPVSGEPLRARMLLALCAGLTMLSLARAAPKHSVMGSAEWELRQNTKALLDAIAPGDVAPDTTQTASQGMHGFDFEYGTWQVHHRVKSAANGGIWKEFDGTCTTRAFMAGQGDIEEHVFFRPTGNTYGTAMRAFDPKTGEWAIWWIDSRYPHFPLDPPAKGRFENGVGTFYSDSVVNGKTVRARLMWSHMTPTSAHWEQASSDDGGKTWDTNWIMEFAR